MKIVIALKDRQPNGSVKTVYISKFEDYGDDGSCSSHGPRKNAVVYDTVKDRKLIARITSGILGGDLQDEYAYVGVELIPIEPWPAYHSEEETPEFSSRMRSWAERCKGLRFPKPGTPEHCEWFPELYKDKA